MDGKRPLTAPLHTHRCRGPCGLQGRADLQPLGTAEAPGVRECLASLYLTANLHWLDREFLSFLFFAFFSINPQFETI